MRVEAICLFLICLSTSAENIRDQKSDFQQLLRILQDFGNSINRFLAQDFDKTVAGLKSADPLHALPVPNISAPCLEKLFYIMGMIDPANLPPPEWVLRFLDAQAKPPSSILEGNLAWFGGFHECMNLSVHKDEAHPAPKDILLEGQYCLVTAGLGNETRRPKMSFLSVPKALRAGLCVPSTCTSNDVEQTVLFALQLLGAKFPQIPIEKITVSEVRCPAKFMSMDAGAVSVVIVLAAFITVVLVGSFYDVLSNGLMVVGVSETVETSTYNSSYTSLLPPDAVDAAEEDAQVKDPRGIFGRLCMAVSIVPHCSNLFSAARGVHDLRWIHGIRVLSMLWIILGQTYALGLPLYDNLVMIPEALKGLFAHVIVQATFAVDTFLFLSGYLATYRLLKDLSAGFDCWLLIRFYVSRYLRLFPVYIVVLGIYATLTKHISSGPLWPQDEVMLGNCSHLAWSNVLYINNYVYPEQMCMPWTWYIAIDFQLFILAPFIILCLFVFWKIGLAICLVCIWTVVICSGVISKVKDLPPSLVGFGSTDVSAFDEEVTIRYFTQYLITTYCRAAPYFFGIVAAHYLRKPEDLPKLSYLWRVFGWIVTMLGIAIVVFGLVPAFNGYPLSTSAAAAFNSLSHIIWSLALAWIAYICVTNHGGLVECFLGWRFWTPFSTISYSTYLFSPIMICVYYLSREEPIRFSHYNALNLFWGNLILSCSAGLMVYLFIEAPVRSLSRLILSSTLAKTTLVPVST